MRWMADECVHGYIVQKLKAAGHDVVLVTDIFPSSDDEPILSLARQERRILLTQDSDFGEMIFRDHFSGAAGIVFLRMRFDPIDLVWQRLETAISELGENLLGHYVVVSANRIR
jgi:predicted nuclease of predicted toxin-antitoxin system